MDCWKDTEDCKGLTLYHWDKKVSIAEDTCYPGSFKVVYVRKCVFEDKSELYYEDVIFCADIKVLSEVSDAIDKFIGERNAR